MRIRPIGFWDGLIERNEIRREVEGCREMRISMFWRGQEIKENDV